MVKTQSKQRGREARVAVAVVEAEVLIASRLDLIGNHYVEIQFVHNKIENFFSCSHMRPTSPALASPPHGTHLVYC